MNCIVNISQDKVYRKYLFCFQTFSVAFGFEIVSINILTIIWTSPRLIFDVALIVDRQPWNKSVFFPQKNREQDQQILQKQHENTRAKVRKSQTRAYFIRRTVYNTNKIFKNHKQINEA